MKILVINCGSSSIKYKFYDMESRTVLAAGGMEKIGLETSFLKLKAADGYSKQIKVKITNHDQGINFILAQLTDSEHGAIKSLAEIDAVGHRIVHGGKFTHSVVVTPEILEEWKQYSELAPLHNPAHLKGYEAIKHELPDVSRFLCSIRLSTRPCRTMLTPMRFLTTSVRNTRYAVTVSTELR